jgi:hypothetical protein
MRKLTRKFFQEQGKLGGQKAQAKKSKAKKAAAMSKAGSAFWAKLTPEERSAEMKRRAKVRAKNAERRRR